MGISSVNKSFSKLIYVSILNRICAAKLTHFLEKIKSSERELQLSALYTLSPLCIKLQRAESV